jgi:hypothetical protein
LRGEIKMKIPNWVVLKYDVKPNVFECVRCGATREAHMPASIDGFMKQGEAFAEDHRFCKKEK